MTQRPAEQFSAPGVLIRRETPADAALIAAVVADNLDHLAPWMPWATPAAGTLEVQRERLTAGRALWDCGAEHGYLLLEPGGALLGIVGLHRRIGPRAVEIGYWLRADAVGRGHVTAAVEVLTAAALALPDVDRVEIHCDAANTRSAAVPPRCGYRLERIDAVPREAPASTGRQMIWVRTIADADVGAKAPAGAAR